MQFVNAILGVPEEVDYKIHLRNEFIRLGLERQIPVSLRTLSASTYVVVNVYMHVCMHVRI